MLSSGNAASRSELAGRASPAEARPGRCRPPAARPGRRSPDPGRPGPAARPRPGSAPAARTGCTASICARIAGPLVLRIPDRPPPAPATPGSSTQHHPRQETDGGQHPPAPAGHHVGITPGQVTARAISHQPSDLHRRPTRPRAEPMPRHPTAQAAARCQGVDPRRSAPFDGGRHGRVTGARVWAVHRPARASRTSRPSAASRRLSCSSKSWAAAVSRSRASCSSTIGR